MFKSFLKAHTLSEYDFGHRIFPDITDRDYWDNYSGADIIESAERYLDYGWPPIKASLFMEFKRSGNRVCMEDVHFERRAALSALAMGELKENSGRFLSEIVDGLFVVCEESYWGLSAHWYKTVGNIPSPYAPYIDLFAAETAEHVAMICFLLRAPLLDFCPEILERVERELEIRIKEPYLTHKDFHWMGYEIKPANWNPWILSNILTVFLLTEKDNAVLNAAIEKMFCEIQHYYDALPKDGGCDEGVHYWDRAGGALFEFVYQLKLASGGALDMFYDEKLCNIGLYMKNAHIQGAQFINFADSSKAKKTSLIPLIYGYGKQTGAQILKKLARTVFCDSDKKEFEPMVNVRRNILFHDLYTEMLSDAEADGFLKEKVSLMSELQVAVLSEGEWILAAKGGHNAESHNHNDVGSFCLYLNGEAVLCDVGTGVYSRKNFSSRRYEIPWVRSLTHNLPVINGVEEKNGAEYFADIFDAEAGRVKISFAKAYPENAGIVSLVRTCNLSESGLSYTDEYEFAGNDNKVSEALVTTLSARVDGECVILGEKYVIRAQGAVPKIEFISFEEDRNLTPAWGCEGLNRITFDFENVKAVTVTVSLR